MTLILGAHMSISNGFVGALNEAHDSLGANAMQIFMKSPRGRAVTKLTREEANEFKDYARKIDFKFTVAHCSYLLNFAKAGSDWSLQSLVDDLKGVEMLGGKGVVLHVGKSLELSHDEAMSFLIKNLKKVLKETDGLKAKIILENTAGQGTEMGRSFEELAEIYDALDKSKRVGFCLDTCHSWAWGYDWKNPDMVFKDFDQVLGLKNLDLIHFNDAMKVRGSRVDRHANLGDGEIGEKALAKVAKFACKNSIPIILETPESKGKTHKDDISVLQGFLSA